MKPIVIYDFAPGHMATRLLAQAVDALLEEGLSQPVATLEQEMRRYFRNKRPEDAVPKQLFEMFSQFIEIWPTDFSAMERVLGTKIARECCPRSMEIPDMVWQTLDWLGYIDPVTADQYRDDLYLMIEMETWTSVRLVETAAKYLHRARTTTYEARMFALDRMRNKIPA